MWLLIDQFFSLQQLEFSFKEQEFELFKQDHSQRLLDNFFDIALAGITMAFVFRILILRSSNAILDLILPFVIMIIISLFYYINKNTNKMKYYFHIVLIPIVGLLTAKKTISQDTNRFYLNESFASWLIMMIFGSFSSPNQWYQVVAINFFCFFSYIFIVFRNYGLKGIGNDFFIHITTTIIFSACLIRMNELNLRNSFNLLSLSKIQEKKWQRVLILLNDGVLIMQHSDNEKGILLMNPSLQKIFKKEIQNNQLDAEKNIEVKIHSCSKNNNFSITKRESNLQKSKNDIIKLQQNPIQSQNSELNNCLDLQSNLCHACEYEQNKKAEEAKQKLKKYEINELKFRYNEKKVAPIFDDLFRTIKFKIVNAQNDKQNNNDNNKKNQKNSKFLNDFICKQLEFFQKDHPQGYSEQYFLKVFDLNKIIELNIVKLDNENQVLFLFKEVSIYNKLSKAQTTEKFSNIMINSIAHNLFTPLNALIQLTKSMSDYTKGINEIADKNVQMIRNCLQQLVFTTHNILEMSKIRQGRFIFNNKSVNILEKFNSIFDYFTDDMKFKEIDFDIKCQDKLKDFQIILDESRFSIVIYNLISNGVKYTNGGQIKVQLKILNSQQYDVKNEKIKDLKKEDEENQKSNKDLNQNDSQEQFDDEDNSFSISEKIVQQTPIQDASEDEQLQVKNQLESYYLSVSVNDTGIGMDYECKKKCFKLFGNLKIKQDVNQGGMGLGLASASLICKAMKGELNLIRSEKNIGSKFKFIIPVQIGKMNIINKDNSDQESSDNSSESNSDSSQSDNQQKTNDQFEKKKAEIIEQIRQKQIQQQKKQNSSDESSNDESSESESDECDEQLEKYKNNQSIKKEQKEQQVIKKLNSSSKEQSQKYCNQSKQSDSQQFSSQQKKEIIKDDSSSSEESQNSSDSSDYSDSQQSFQEQKKIIQKDKKGIYQQIYEQQSIIENINMNSMNSFGLKQEYQILSQNQDKNTSKTGQYFYKINQSTARMTKNQFDLHSTNIFDKKNDQDTPSSPNTSSVFQEDDSFIDFLNDSQNNQQLTSRLIKQHQFERIQSNQNNLQQKQQYFQQNTQHPRILSLFENNKMNHSFKNPFSINIENQQNDSIKRQLKKIKSILEEQSSIIEEYESEKIYSKDTIRLNSNDQFKPINQINNEIQMLLNHIEDDEKQIKIQKIQQSFSKTSASKQEEKESRVNSIQQKFKDIKKKSKFYYQTFKKKKSNDLETENCKQSSFTISSILQLSNDSQNIIPIIEKQSDSSQNKQQQNKIIENVQNQENNDFDQQILHQSRNQSNSLAMQQNKIINQSSIMNIKNSINSNTQSINNLNIDPQNQQQNKQKKSHQNNDKKKKQIITQSIEINRNQDEILSKNLKKKIKTIRRKKSNQASKKDTDQKSQQSMSENFKNENKQYKKSVKKNKKCLKKQITIMDENHGTKLTVNEQKNSLKSCEVDLLSPFRLQSGIIQNDKTVKVLIVDDTVFNIQILQMIFKNKYNLQVDEAISGEEAIMKCKQRVNQNLECYKLILMDINMPQMDGVVATANIRKFIDPYLIQIHQKDFMIVAHTAIPEDQFGNYQNKGFHSFLQKPIDHQQLLQILKTVHLK